MNFAYNIIHSKTTMESLEDLDKLYSQYSNKFAHIDEFVFNLKKVIQLYEASLNGYEIIPTYFKDNRCLNSIRTVNLTTKKETSINDKPSYIEYNRLGNIIYQRWKKEDKFYFRGFDLPSEEKFEKDKSIRQSWSDDVSKINERRYVTRTYFPSGKINREYYSDYDININNPLIIEHEEIPCHHIKRKTWNDSLFRKNLNIDLPMYIEYNHLGKITKEVYPRKNTLGLPTIRIWDATGEILIQEDWTKWSKKTRSTILHRKIKKGPARITYYPNGEPFIKSYYEKNALIKTEIFDKSN